MNMMNSTEKITKKVNRMTIALAGVNVDTETCDSRASGSWDLNNLNIQSSTGPDSLIVNFNGINVAWDDQKVDCLTCHTALLR